MSWTPKRSQTFGVGKEIGGAVYVHRSSESVLGEVVASAKTHLPPDFQYDVVKLTFRSNEVSFVSSPDFDTADEPIVGMSVTVAPDGTVRHRSESRNPQIYHHKWLFVAADYPGFDVVQSMERSKLWLALSDVDAKRIGRKEYWETLVVPRIVPAEDC